MSIPTGYSEGRFLVKRYGTTIRRSSDGRLISQFVEELAETEKVSFDLYRLTSGGAWVKPYEIPHQKAVDFVIGQR